MKSINRVIFLIFILFIHACAYGPPQETASSSEPTPSSTSMIFKATHTLSTNDSQVLSSPIFEQEITPHPEYFLTVILSGIEGCSLPCWNNVTPGSSNVSEIVPFFERLGIIVDDDELPDGVREQGSIFRQPAIMLEGGGWFYVFLGWEGDQVKDIGLGFGDLPDFLQPSKLTQSIGYPETIEVAFLSSDDNNAYEYVIRLRYPSIRSAFRYSGWLDVTQQSEICIDVSEGIMIKIDISSHAEDDEFMRYPLGPPFGSTEEILGITEPQFLDLFIDEQNCVPIGEQALQ